MEAALKIAVQAPPLEGRANDELLAYLAEIFDVSRSAVVLHAGVHSRRKLIRVRGLSATQVELALRDHLSV